MSCNVYRIFLCFMIILASTVASAELEINPKIQFSVPISPSGLTMAVVVGPDKRSFSNTKNSFVYLLDLNTSKAINLHRPVPRRILDHGTWPETSRHKPTLKTWVCRCHSTGILVLQHSNGWATSQNLKACRYSTVITVTVGRTRAATLTAGILKEIHGRMNFSWYQTNKRALTGYSA